MRVDLKVPYAEKDAAKRLGARWDAARKVWYVQNIEDISKFMRWMTYAHGKKPKRKAVEPTPLKGGGDHQRLCNGIRTEATDLSLADCDCSVPPWEDCHHTVPVDHQHVAHLRAILSLNS